MPSLLCAHVLESSRSALDYTLRAQVPAVKLVNAFSRAAEYRAVRPDLLIVARNVLDKDDRWRDFIHNPEAYYNAHVGPHLSHPANKDIDVWETGVNEDGPRKLDGTDRLDVLDMAARGGLEGVVAQMIAANGKRPCVGNFAVGNPSGTFDEQLAAWRAYLPTLRVAARFSGYLGLHVYFDVSGWELVLRSLLQVLAEASLPINILITECGLANGSQGVHGALYANRAMQFDQQLKRDFPTVKAAFIYSFGSGGGGGWTHFDVDGWSAFLDPLTAYGASQKPRPTNQAVFNAVRAATNRAVGAVMPYDAMTNALEARRKNPQAPYDGPPPEEWGPTPEEVAEIKRRTGL